MSRKQNAIKRALKKLLGTQRYALQQQGYKNEDEMIEQLMKIPISELKAKEKELKAKKKENEVNEDA